MTPTSMRLGRAVRTLRAGAGFSQERFAAAVGIHRTFLSALERGQANPSLDTLERIAHSLRMTTWELLRIAQAAGSVDPG